MLLNVALISEGSYPTGKGGVSEWCHSLISGMNDVRFNVFSKSNLGEPTSFTFSQDDVR